jgi:hypothetical protein
MGRSPNLASSKLKIISSLLASKNSSQVKSSLARDDPGPASREWCSGRGSFHRKIQVKSSQASHASLIYRTLRLKNKAELAQRLRARAHHLHATHACVTRTGTRTRSSRRVVTAGTHRHTHEPRPNRALRVHTNGQHTHAHDTHSTTALSGQLNLLWSPPRRGCPQVGMCTHATSVSQAAPFPCTAGTTPPPKTQPGAGALPVPIILARPMASRGSTLRRSITPRKPQRTARCPCPSSGPSGASRRPLASRRAG